ncbi:MAG: DUF4373 domain-containing protein [Prevotella sp.]|jgi:hypothetical protein|nr:DUF4373 domain-containing protein [Prevotella sp.]
MAGRPTKQGLEYFPLDVDFFNDEKIEFVSARFGVKGEIITMRLLCKIYRNGYYTAWNEDTALLFAKGVGDGCQDSCVKDVVYELLKRGFFDRSIFERFSILTSRGIQNRYANATNERKEIKINQDFWLIHIPKNAVVINNQDVNAINRPINSDNRQDNSQSKVKESKEYFPPYPPRGDDQDVNAINRPINSDNRQDNSINADKNKQSEAERLVSRKRKPKKPMQESEEPSLNSKARELFNERFKALTQEDYYWVAKDAGSMAQILNKLKYQREQKDPPLPTGDDDILKALSYLLNSIKDEWILQNFTPCIVNSRFNEIVLQAKLKSNGNRSTTSRTANNAAVDKPSEKTSRDYSQRF